MAGFYRIWIPNSGLIAKPLYEATQGPDHEPLEWSGKQQEAFQKLKPALLSAPALGIPDLNNPFTLYVAEKQGMALGVLVQKLGDIPRPVAYFSKQLDSESLGWPGCLRAVAATALLVEEAAKLTLGHLLEVQPPHQVQSVLDINV